MSEDGDIGRLRERVSRLENYARALITVAAIFGVGGGIGATMLRGATSELTKLRDDLTAQAESLHTTLDSLELRVATAEEATASVDALVASAKSKIEGAGEDALDDFQKRARAFAPSARALNDAPLRVVGGATDPGNTAWEQMTSKGKADPNGLFLHVDVSQAGFKACPTYVISLGGKSHHWTTQGTASVYNPSKDGFDVYLRHSQAVDPKAANSDEWHVNWVAIGPP